MFDKHKIEKFNKCVAKLDDRPQMSAQELKEYFDSPAEVLREQFNALIDTLDGFSNASLDAVDYNAAEYKLTFTFKNGSTQTIDLPLELLIESGHYDADTQCIVLTLANNDVITIPVSDLIDEYEADEKTLHMAASETSRVFSVKEGVFATEAPADNKPYMRKNGTWQPYEAPRTDEKTTTMTAEGEFSVKDGVFTPEAPADGKSYARSNKSWQEVVKGLEEITYEDVDNVLDGVYVVERFGVKGVLCACLDLFVYDGNGSGKLDTFDAENFQTILWSDGRIEHRNRGDLIMALEYWVVQNEDGTYRLKDGYVFDCEWSKWESAFPSLKDYATKTYVGEQIDDAKKNELELIASGVTTEEVNSIIISKDNDGNPFELCDMITIYSMSPAGKNASSLSYAFNNVLIQQTSTNGVSDTGAMYHRLVGIHSGKRWDTYCYTTSNISSNNNVQTRDRYGQTTAKTVKSIKLYLLNSDHVLPVGIHSGKRWDTYCYTTSNISSNNNVQTRDRYGQTTAKTVKSIKLYLLNSDHVLPVGFEYEIYGRRVKNANT